MTFNPTIHYSDSSTNKLTSQEEIDEDSIDEDDNQWNGIRSIHSMMEENSIQVMMEESDEDSQ